MTVTVYAKRAALNDANRFAARAGTTRVVIGSAFADLIGVDSMTATVRRNAIGRHALQRAPSLSINLTLKATDTAGVVSTSTAQPTLSPLVSVVVPADGIFDANSWTLNGDGLVFLAHLARLIPAGTL